MASTRKVRAGSAARRELPAGSSLDGACGKLRELVGDEVLASVFDFLPVPMSLADQKRGIVLAVNAAFTRTTGFTSADMVGHSASELGLLDASERAAAHKRFKAFGRLVDHPIRFRCKDGEERLGLISAQHLADGAFLTALVDVTELKTTEAALRAALAGLEEHVRARTRDLRGANAALRESQQKFRTLAETAPVAIGLVQEGRFGYLSPFSQAVFGRPCRELLKREYWRVAVPEDQAALRSWGRRHLAGEAPPRREIRVRTSDGGLRFLELDGGALQFGGSPALLVAAHDVTTRKQGEQDRAIFVQMLTHDLRTPLSAIMALAQCLERAPGRDPLEQQRIAGILRSSRKMEGMLRDLADVARGECGQLVLRRRPLALAPFLEEALRGVEPALAGERVRLKLPRRLPEVLADPERLERVLDNVVGNALRYSAAGSPVEVRARSSARFVTLSVVDRGPGISGEELPRIFDRYFRGAQARRSSGFGLGLYTARMLTEANGGRIWAESRLGRGSAFHITLPRARG